MAEESGVITVSIEELLGRNSALHNIHAGKRCFILGNGPSLKQVDLSLLADEFVFTVSLFNSIEGWQKAKPNFHVLYDPALCNLSESTELRHRVVKIFHDLAPFKTTFFCLVSGFPFIKYYRLDEFVNIQYIMNGSPIYSNAPLQLDITKPITGFWNVVQCAIVAAIYMGFKEIYLLGVDFTGILTFTNTVLGLPLEDHAYDNEDFRPRYEETIKKYGMTEMLFRIYLMFLGCDKLNYACWNLLNIKLINCSAQTLITSIPRMDLMHVLKNESKMLMPGS